MLCRRVGETGLCRARAGLESELLFRPHTRLQRAKGHAALFQLGLQRTYADFELLLAQLSDQIAPGNPLTFPDRNPDEEPGNLEREFSLLRGLRPAGKNPGLKLAAWSENNCFHRADNFWRRRSLARAPGENAKQRNIDDRPL